MYGGGSFFFFFLTHSCRRPSLFIAVVLLPKGYNSVGLNCIIEEVLCYYKYINVHSGYCLNAATIEGQIHRVLKGISRETTTTNGQFHSGQSYKSDLTFDFQWAKFAYANEANAKSINCIINTTNAKICY